MIHIESRLFMTNSANIETTHAHKKAKKNHAEKETEWWPFKCSGMKTTQLLCFKKLVNVDVAMIIIHVGSFILVHWVFRVF